MNDKKYCFSCFRPNEGETCRHCGFSAAAEGRPSLALPIGSILNGRYLIGKVLGLGGFGITYLAFDLVLEQKVAIKEYMPTGVATREADRYTISAVSVKEQSNFQNGESRFLEEARILARLKDTPHIVPVYDYFRENGSAYFVMDYIEGRSLKEEVKQRGGRISVEEALHVLLPLMHALNEVHDQGLLHRDISPDNIYITDKGESMLLDFGAARFALSNDKSLSVILKHGFAPEEQYRSHGHQGPWSDVYAMAATIYLCISGQLPPDALERGYQDSLIPPSQLGVRIGPACEAALLRALAVRAEDRYPNMELFASGLLADVGPAAPQTFDAVYKGGQIRSERLPLPRAKEPAAYGPDAAAAVAEQANGTGGFRNMFSNKKMWPWLGGAALLLLLAILLPVLLLSSKGDPSGGGYLNNAGGNVAESSKANPPSQATAPSQESVPSQGSLPPSTEGGSDSTAGATVPTAYKEFRDASYLAFRYPEDMELSAAFPEVYLNRGSYTKFYFNFHYSLGAPMYTLDDFNKYAREVVPYALLELNLQASPVFSDSFLTQGNANGIPFSRCHFKLEGEDTLWSLIAFPASTGPGCYTMLCAQSPSDPSFDKREAELLALLDSLQTFDGIIGYKSQVIVNASAANLQMVYAPQLCQPSPVEDGELFHMYFEESQFGGGRAGIDVYDISDKAATLDEALSFVRDQVSAYATVGEGQTIGIYTAAGKNIKTAIFPFVFKDEPSRQMEMSIHVIQAGNSIFALQGYYGKEEAQRVIAQLDTIGLSLDVQH